MDIDRIAQGIFVLVMSASMVMARDDGQHQQPDTPLQKFNALLKEYDDAFEVYAAAFQEAQLPVDREKAIREKYPKPEKWTSQFLELAEQNPKEPFAEDALIWILTSESRLKRFLPWHEHTPRYEMIWIIQGRGGIAGDEQKPDVRGKAVEMLLRDHVTSAKMGDVARMLSRDRNSAKLLRAIVDENPNNEVKAEASLALFREIQGDIGLARQLKSNPQSAKTVEPFYGKSYVEEMLQSDLAGLEAKSAAIYTELTEKHILKMKPARLVELCQELKYTIDSENLLRFIYENEQRHEVRGVACLILAQALNGRAFSLATTDASGAEKLHQESETLLEEAAGKYAGVQMPREGSVGKKAKGILFDLRHLSIGKSSPEIEGLDQDGKQFALSDYKGKVVLLDFWSEF